MEKHFVVFCSPGTLEIKERYGALPYGFYFTTRSRNEEDLDSHESARSHMYYLGGEVLTLKQVRAKDDPDDKILISNMEANKWDRIVINTNSYKWTQPLEKGDIVLDT